MRKALSTLAAKSVYSAHVLPTILYCSTPVLQISDTMTQKFEKLQEKALQIIYCQANQNREIRFGSILNQKKLKAACLIFKCLQGTSIPAFSSYATEICYNYRKRNNNKSLRVLLLRTEAARRSFWFQGPHCYNDLPLEIRSLNSFVLFKSRLKEYYAYKCKQDILVETIFLKLLCYYFDQFYIVLGLLSLSFITF